MVLVSRKVDYAIVAMTHLARFEGAASAREIADYYGLSRSFLANILKQLCQCGFVESRRGVNGGYSLALPSADITLEMIISALDGPFQLVDCSETSDKESCGLMDACPIQSPLKAVHERLVAALSEVSLDDLISPHLVPLETETNANG